MQTCCVAMGGNVGVVSETFRQAVTLLEGAAHLRVTQVSAIYKTSPVGEHSGGLYRNAALELKTDRMPEELLETLQSVEQRLGRTRPYRWSSRTLDLDLVFYGDQVIETPRLTVPHPACWYRRFVLDPLTEIAPKKMHPLKQRTVQQLHAHLIQRPFQCVLVGDCAEVRSELLAELHREFLAVEFTSVETDESLPLEESTLVAWLGPTSSNKAVGAKESRTDPIGWLDASARSEGHLTFLRHVLHSALGDCVPEDRGKTPKTQGTN